MKIAGWLIAGVALLITPALADSVDSQVCAGCHPKIYAKYRETGMARSFYRPQTGSVAPASYYHAVSDTHFTIFERGGKFYQRRYQIGFGGRETNIDEKSIDFVMGSGSRVRTYLHQTEAGALEQLPLAWYAEKGGYPAMNPGYDKPDQPNSRRKISYECMFCHNSYPAIPKGHEVAGAEPLFTGALPEGIDCQRCHGAGALHVQTAQRAGASAAAIRSAILNPARLTADRQMEVCMQCHLETTSFPFPHSIVKYDRAPFSYRPDEPLGAFIRYFEPASPSGGEDRFQIVNSAYRLRMSQCFLKSEGKLQCTTCHDPHGGEKDVNGVCRDCHTGAFKRVVDAGRHTSAVNCVECHMPKRRTDDVVHAVMTDHLIQRQKPVGDLLAEKAEPNGAATVNHGDALAYLPRSGGDPLYLAVAQVEAENTPEHRAQLRRAIEKGRPGAPEFYVELADVLRGAGDAKGALPVYEQALRNRAGDLASLVGLGQSLTFLGQDVKAADAFRRAAQGHPSSALAWQELGQALMKTGAREEALAALRKSVALDSGVPEAHYALASYWAGPGMDAARAETSFREAIRLQPDYAQARMNLAILLSRDSRMEEAAYQFEYALRVRPEYALARLNYGSMLRSVNRRGEAVEQYRLAAAGSDAGIRAAAQRALDELGAR